MKRLILNFLISLSGNRIAQKILREVEMLARQLRGFGSGSFTTRSGEASALSFVHEKIKTNERRLVIFDIGANKGQFLELILNEFRISKKQVVSFEPSTAAYRVLQNKFGALNDVMLQNLGVDDHVHTGSLYYDQPGSLYASKYDRDVSRLNVEFTYSEKVNYVTVDSFCSSHEIDMIDFLKIDVEGNELNVLKGAERMLSDRLIRSMSFEFGSTQIDSRTFFKDIYLYLEQFNFESFYRITPGGYLEPIMGYDEALEIYYTTNYLVLFE